MIMYYTADVVRACHNVIGFEEYNYLSNNLKMHLYQIVDYAFVHLESRPDDGDPGDVETLCAFLLQKKGFSDAGVA